MNAEYTKRAKRARNVGGPERLVSIVGGGTLVAWGLARRGWDGVALATLGGALVYRGATGHCGVYQAFGVNTASHSGRNVSIPYETGIRVDQTITIARPPAEVYRFWRNLENLPKFMRGLESVQEIDNQRSHWVARGPAGVRFEWDAEVINEKENERIGWRSLGGSEVANAGSVHFTPTADGQATVVTLELQYDPPGGKVAAALARWMGRNPAAAIEEDLKGLKAILETGEIAAKRQSGRRAGTGWNRDVVTAASEESFPASDPPSWTPETL